MLNISVQEKREADATLAEVRRSGAGHLANFANDYSRYCKIDITEEMGKMEEFIEEALAKLEEFVSLFEMKEAETQSWADLAFPTLLYNSTALLQTFSQKLDTLVAFHDKIYRAIDDLDNQVAQAEADLGATSSFRSMMNYFRKPDMSETSSKLPPECVHIDVDEFFIKSSLDDAE